MSDVIFSNEMDEEMTLNMGPHHPSTHGVLRFIISSDGEIIRKAVPDVGYLHRSLEKIAERCTYSGYMPYTDEKVPFVTALDIDFLGGTTIVETYHRMKQLK